MEAWRLSCLSIEELLCLQLLGYSPRQLYEDIESERYSLKETASMSIRELDKAKDIGQADKSRSDYHPLS